jgi:hypothetical protein
MFGKCIYCPAEGEMSDEHYLPRCLGRFRGYELLSDRVCERCNNRLSPLDEQFCRSGTEAIVRDLLGVKGGRVTGRFPPSSEAALEPIGSPSPGGPPGRTPRPKRWSWMWTGRGDPSAE